MGQFMNYLYIGLGNGAIYATLAVGLVVIYRASGLMNFAPSNGLMMYWCRARPDRRPSPD